MFGQNAVLNLFKEENILNVYVAIVRREAEFATLKYVSGVMIILG